jgi:hypothetical protein
VDRVMPFEPVPTCNLHVTDFTPSDRPAFFGELGSRCTLNGSVKSLSSEKGMIVGWIHNGIHIHHRKVLFYELDGAFHGCFALTKS